MVTESARTNNGDASGVHRPSGTPVDVGLKSRFRTWPLLILAFGILLTLMLLSGVATLNRATELHHRLSVVNQDYRRDLRGLDDIRSGIHVSSVLIRDYLLDPWLARQRKS